jgi:hypothetical protein
MRSPFKQTYFHVTGGMYARLWEPALKSAEIINLPWSDVNGNFRRD